MDPNVDQSTKAWFESIDSPNPLPGSSEPRPSNTKWKLIAIVFVCVVLAASAFAYTITSNTQPAAIGKCLDSSNYEKFLGIKNEDKLQAQENFHTQPLGFVAGETNFPDSEKTASNDFLKKIGTFYQNNHNESSVIVSITVDYLEGQSAQVAKDRITKLKQLLIEYGVTEAAIRTSTPQLITTEDESATDTRAIISISSNAKCQ